MRRIVAVAVVVAMSLTSAPLFAASAPRAARVVGLPQLTGKITGKAKNSQGQDLPNYTVRVRNLANGNISGSTTTTMAGDFLFTDLTAPGNYAVEIVNAAGDIIGTSASIPVAAGQTVSITVIASAASALGGAGGAAAGGAAAASAGISRAVIITTVAGTAGVLGIVVAVKKHHASPSR